MIKEYFTDGLISLAILLSLFRTDLTGINDIISYPEVQDIILGQTVAYLPANFHNAYDSLHLTTNRKDIDLENAWFQNIHNLPRFRQNRRDLNHFDAFLVNAPVPNTIVEQFHQADPPTTQQDPSEDEVRNSTSPSLPLEGANSYDVGVNGTLNETHGASQDPSSSIEAPVFDISFCTNSTFPGCNLTKEDLDLIDVLWRQDVDLGVGKEVFDHNLRHELEKERELEIAKQNEKLRTERLNHEKEERQKQEHANKWLKENFMRDGETGEWVRLQNGTSIGNDSLASLPLPDSFNSSETNDWTLEAALDYISESVDPALLNSLESGPVAPSPHLSPLPPMQYTSEYASAAQYQEPQQLAVGPDVKHEQPIALQTQDSLEEHWSGLVTYLNMSGDLATQANSTGMMIPSLSLTPPMESVVSQYGEHMNPSDYLLQNASLPASLDHANDFNVLTPVTEINTTLAPQVTPEVVDPAMDFDLGDLSFFNNLTHLQDGASNDLDLAAVNNIFTNLTEEDTEVLSSGINLAEDMDSIQMIQDDLNDTCHSLGASSTGNDLGVFDGLEGATGGADFSTNDSHSSPFAKLSRLSESSNDSGFAYQGGFSSSSSPPSSSSSITGSPASGNLTSSNDTEHDPQGSRAVIHAHPHVAHNHTYNTLPGQVPREVKKYAPKPPSRKGPHSRDQRRATEMKIPFTVEEIINAPVEAFNELLTRHKLSEPQLTLVRDIRRRGKNKVAAQNCRKRKVGVIVTLADEMDDLQKMRDRLVEERAQMERETRRMRDKFHQMYNQIFQSLRDDQGQPYDPTLYSLQQSSDGNVFLVPRSTNATKAATPAGPKSSDASGSRKRKTFDH